MSHIQSAPVANTLSDDEIVELQKPLLREAAYRALPRIKKACDNDTGSYARKIEYFVTMDLASNLKPWDYSPEVTRRLGEYLMELFLEIHKQEFTNG